MTTDTTTAEAETFSGKPIPKVKWRIKEQGSESHREYWYGWVVWEKVEDGRDE